MGVAGAGIESIRTLHGTGTRGAAHSHVHVYITEAWSSCKEDFGMSGNT